ncbi:Lipoprotein-releasing system ATP-binding protein LolD [Clavibacter michiganensis]|nr:Lipoprotein-releasing system ATP-binding protein LolD [Clavibacter michiganensis]
MSPSPHERSAAPARADGSVPVIEAVGLGRTYGKGSSAFLALRDVSLSIHPGESVAITGKSGSGKSTLMHLLGLLDSPDAGSLRIGGQPVDGLSGAEADRIRNRRFGFIFQQFYLNPTEDIRDNAVTALKIAGVRRSERRARADDLLRLVDLGDKARNRATDLSGGQKQRVAIARALAASPDVIFADEPTGNLDSENGERVEELLFSLHRDQGITLVIVTHDEDLASRCDRRIVIADGAVQSDARSERDGVRA